MSTTDVKELLSQMSPEDRDDIMLHILTLRESDEGPELSKIWIEELNMRKAAYDSGRMSGRPLQNVLSELGVD